MNSSSETLSTQQARKLVLLSQKLPPTKTTGSAVSATLSAIEHLGYIQIDTISVIQRAHHHTLWNRNPRYKNDHLDQLVREKKVFEYWSHAAAYLPMRDYRFSLMRKQALANGDLEHWYKRDKKMMNSVLRRIATEGPLMAKDFDHGGEKTGEWNSKPAKRALETLFMQGELMAPYRDKFHKVYDLTERVLPGEIDTTPPSADEYARFLITRYLQANGLGRPAEMAYLLKKTRQLIVTTAKDMALSGEVLELRVGDHHYYTLPSTLQLLDRPLARSKLKILSPFDNLLIQRKRASMLFNYDYLLECYLPASKRQHGYFSLPILWDGRLVARMDCKADRKQSLLNIHLLSLEPGIGDLESFGLALSKELKMFLAFNDCSDVHLYKTNPNKLAAVLQPLL